MRKQILLLVVMLACVAIFGACFDDETGTSECQHSGGVATCQKKAVCEKCGEEYGELDSTNHHLEKIPAKAPTSQRENRQTI